MANQKFKEFVFEVSPFGPPSRGGIYMVVVVHPETKCEHILYIGSSGNILRRVMDIRHPYRIAFDRLDKYWVVTKSIITEDFINLEKEAIAYFRPLINKQYKPISNGLPIYGNRFVG